MSRICTAPAVQTAAPETVKRTRGGEALVKAEFEKSLFDSYGKRPVKYEDLGNGIYQVYVEHEGRVIPFVTVDSATGDYHG